MDKNENYQALTTNENNELAMRAHNGDEEAKEKLFLSNEKLLWSVVHQYSRSEFDKEDLFQEASIGFFTALLNYDIKKGSFTTYATSWMRAMILKFFNKQEGFHIEPSFYQKKIRYERLKGNSKDSDFTKEQLEEYNLSFKDIQKIEEHSKEIYSLDAIVEQEVNNEYNFADKDFGDTDAIESIVINKERSELILKAIDKCLTDKEKFVIFKRYGFDGPPMKMTEISKLYVKEFGVDSCRRQNIQQIKALAENKLRNMTSIKNLV